MFSGFREFIMRGNVVDLAVAVVIGTAFGAVITSFVTDILTPLLGVFGLPNFAELSFSVGKATVNYGLFLNALLAFLLIVAGSDFAKATGLSGVVRALWTLLRWPLSIGFAVVAFAVLASLASGSVWPSAEPVAEPLPTWPLLTPAHFVSIVARSLVEHALNADELKTRFLSKKITALVTAKEPAGLTGPGVVAVVTFSEPTDTLGRPRANSTDVVIEQGDPAHVLAAVGVYATVQLLAALGKRDWPQAGFLAVRSP